MFLAILSAIAVAFFFIRSGFGSFLLFLVKKWFRFLEDKCYAYQFFKVPEFNQYMQENQLYRKVSSYLSSLSGVEDSDFTNLFSGNKSKEINVVLDSRQVVMDDFLGARVSWANEESDRTGLKSLVLKIRRCDKRRILRPYLQHILSAFDEMEQRRKEVRLFVNILDGRWRSVALNHPATIDTMVMDSDLKSKIKSDLETFLKSKQYYHRLGRLWKRSYLLYGPSGTGKTTFVAGMAKFLGYDVYDIDLCRVSNDSDLKMLLLQTKSKSVILIEDLDRHLLAKSTGPTLSGILNFMDGIFSCCGEERVMVFTMTTGKDQIDPTVLRPGRVDVHVHFPLCDFNAFKNLANSHLGLKDHKLFSQVEDMFQTGATLSPAEVGEIMISNRSSPNRALKSVISALQTSCEEKAAARQAQRLGHSGSGRTHEDSGDKGIFGKEGIKEARKLYGLLRLRSSRKESFELDASEKESSRHGS